MVVKYLISAAIGAFILYWFFWPEITTNTVTVEKITVDTFYVETRDTLYFPVIEHEYLRDTIIELFEPKISAYKALFPVLYGNVSVTGEVLGKCFNARKTITFGLPKTGFYRGRGLKVCGEIIIADIGFPEDLVKEFL